MNSKCKFAEIVNNAYNYEEALKRQGLKQADVDLLREKMKRSKLVPRFINDKQVKSKRTQNVLKIKLSEPL